MTMSGTYFDHISYACFISIIMHVMLIVCALECHFRQEDKNKSLVCRYWLIKSVCIPTCHLQVSISSHVHSARHFLQLSMCEVTFFLMIIR